MEPGQRIDKWLWIARVVKTRTLATRLVSRGTVRINGARVAKPSKSVWIDDVITLVHRDRIHILKVVGFGATRGPYAEAVLLYEDLSPAETQTSRSKKPGATPPAQREKGTGRPTKKQRRELSTWIKRDA